MSENKPDSLELSESEYEEIKRLFERLQELLKPRDQELLKKLLLFLTETSGTDSPNARAASPMPIPETVITDISNSVLALGEALEVLGFPLTTVTKPNVTTPKFYSKEADGDSGPHVAESWASGDSEFDKWHTKTLRENHADDVCNHIETRFSKMTRETVCANCGIPVDPTGGIVGLI